MLIWKIEYASITNKIETWEEYENSWSTSYWLQNKLFRDAWLNPKSIMNMFRTFKHIIVIIRYFIKILIKSGAGNSKKFQPTKQLHEVCKDKRLFVKVKFHSIRNTTYWLTYKTLKTFFCVTLFQIVSTFDLKAS